MKILNLNISFIKIRRVISVFFEQWIMRTGHLARLGSSATNRLDVTSSTTSFEGPFLSCLINN